MISISSDSDLFFSTQEAHEKEFDCIRKSTFVNMYTIHNLALRLRQSREPTAFLVAQFLATLPASFKEPELLNNPMYEDLLLPLSVRIWIIHFP